MPDHPNEELLHAWVDGGLSKDKTKEIETHLEYCSMCKQAVTEIRWLANACKELPVAPFDNKLVHRTVKEWKAEKKKFKLSWMALFQDRIIEMLRPLTLAAVAFGLFLGITLGFASRSAIMFYFENGDNYAVEQQDENELSSNTYINLLLTEEKEGVL